MEENKNPIKKGNIWSLLSFISGVLVIFLMLYLEFIAGAFIFSVIAIICGIVGFKTNANRIFSFVGLSFGILLLIFLIISIIPSPSSRDKAQDARITADMGYLKSLAELYYTNNNSYVEFEKDSDTIKIREDIIKMEGTNFVINVNPDGKQYCAEVLTNVQKWYCVDSTGVAKRYSYNPSCAVNYFTCEQEELEDETADWKTYRNEKIGIEFKYPRDYTVDESFIARIGSIRIEGPNDLSIFISKSTGGLGWIGKTIVKEEQLSLRDYLNYYYKVTHFEDPISGAYKNPEYREIMSTGRFVNIISTNRDVEIWRKRLTPNMDGFESEAYLMNKNDRITIVELNWSVTSYNHDEIFGTSLLTQFDKILSTFRFLE